MIIFIQTSMTDIDTIAITANNFNFDINTSTDIEETSTSNSWNSIGTTTGKEYNALAVDPSLNRLWHTAYTVSLQYCDYSLTSPTFTSMSFTGNWANNICVDPDEKILFVIGYNRKVQYCKYAENSTFNNLGDLTGDVETVMCIDTINKILFLHWSSSYPRYFDYSNLSGSWVIMSGFIEGTYNAIACDPIDRILFICSYNDPVRYVNYSDLSNISTDWTVINKEETVSTYNQLCCDPYEKILFVMFGSGNVYSCKYTVNSDGSITSNSYTDTGYSSSYSNNSLAIDTTNKILFAVSQYSAIKYLKYSSTSSWTNLGSSSYTGNTYNKLCVDTSNHILFAISYNTSLSMFKYMEESNETTEMNLEEYIKYLKDKS